MVSSQRGFEYFHEGVWKTGYYDPDRAVFVGTSGGQVTTVIGDVSENYIRNLQQARP